MVSSCSASILTSSPGGRTSDTPSAHFSGLEDSSLEAAMMPYKSSLTFGRHLSFRKKAFRLGANLREQPSVSSSAQERKRAAAPIPPCWADVVHHFTVLHSGTSSKRQQPDLFRKTTRDAVLVDYVSTQCSSGVANGSASISAPSL